MYGKYCKLFMLKTMKIHLWRDHCLFICSMDWCI